MPGVSTLFHDEGLFDQVDRMAAGYTEPKIVVFTGGEVLIEKPYFQQKGSFQHHG